MLKTNDQIIKGRIVNIRGLWRQRQDLHKAEKSLTNNIKAKCRRFCGGDKKDAGVLYKSIFGQGDHILTVEAETVTLPFFVAREVLIKERKQTEKALKNLAHELSVWEWVLRVRGVSEISLISIVGEAGDLSNYATISRLYKRMGLAVFDGRCQRKVKDREDAKRQGYNPLRRSVMWSVGACLIRSRNLHYKAIYDTRKEFELQNPEVKTKIHAHRRAKRYMEKAFLNDLWKQWGGQQLLVITNTCVPPQTEKKAA